MIKSRISIEAIYQNIEIAQLVPPLRDKKSYLKSYVSPMCGSIHPDKGMVAIFKNEHQRHFVTNRRRDVMRVLSLFLFFHRHK